LLQAIKLFVLASSIFHTFLAGKTYADGDVVIALVFMGLGLLFVLAYGFLSAGEAEERLLYLNKNPIFIRPTKKAGEPRDR